MSSDQADIVLRKALESEGLAKNVNALLAANRAAVIEALGEDGVRCLGPKARGLIGRGARGGLGALTRGLGIALEVAGSSTAGLLLLTPDNAGAGEYSDADIAFAAAFRDRMAINAAAADMDYNLSAASLVSLLDRSASLSGDSNMAATANRLRVILDSTQQQVPLNPPSGYAVFGPQGGMTAKDTWSGGDRQKAIDAMFSNAVIKEYGSSEEFVAHNSAN